MYFNYRHIRFSCDSATQINVCLFMSPGRPTATVDTCTDCRCDTKTLQVICERINCPVLGCPKERQTRQNKGDCCKVCMVARGTQPIFWLYALSPLGLKDNGSAPLHCKI